MSFLKRIKRSLTFRVYMVLRKISCLLDKLQMLGTSCCLIGQNVSCWTIALPIKLCFMGPTTLLAHVFTTLHLPPSPSHLVFSTNIVPLIPRFDRVALLWHKRLNHAKFQLAHIMSACGLSTSLPWVSFLKHLCFVCRLAKHHSDKVPKKFVHHAT